MTERETDVDDFRDMQREWAEEVALDSPCPTCGHRLHAHADRAHWSDGTCSACRRETNPYASGNPRKQEDCCQLTSSEVRAALQETP